MWYHSSDGLVENSGGSTEVEGAATSGIESSDFSEIGLVLHCSKIRVSAECFESQRVEPAICAGSLLWQMWWTSRTFCTEELSGDIDSFTTDDHDLLPIQQLLRYRTGQATKQVSLPIDHNLLKGVSKPS